MGNNPICENCDIEMEFRLKNLTLGETLFKCHKCGHRVVIKDKVLNSPEKLSEAF
jgi:DNA-directed RNA polymerase subunit RPC12/RpoP